MKEHFDQQTYQANISALKSLQRKAETLTYYWGKLCPETPLTKELYAAWLSDPDFIFKQYREIQTGKGKMTTTVFDRLPEETRRPTLDDPPPENPNLTILSTRGVQKMPRREKPFLQVYARANHVENLIGKPYFVSGSWLDWQQGQPIISEKTEAAIREQCTTVFDETTAKTITDLQSLIDIINQLQTPGGINALPFKQGPHGRLELDFTKLKNQQQ